jgi:uncharacterized protein YeaO (DUF488 family)
MIRIKRVYGTRTADDGVRVLVDRLWPRGLSKARAGIDEWRKEWAPSTELRTWFGHDPGKWDLFRARYRNELTASGQMAALKDLAKRSRHETITLVYSAADEAHNQAVALKDFLEALTSPGDEAG